MAIQLFIKYMTTMTHQIHEKFSEKKEMLIPEIIYEGDRCCYAHIMLGDKIYAIGDNSMFEVIVDGEYVN